MTEEFETFVRETAPRLHRTAWLLCGDHHAAEDLVQSAYAQAFARWRRVSRADDPVAYTRAILVNAFRSVHRLKRSGEIPTDVTTEREARPLDPDLRLDLTAALAALPPIDRSVVVLRYWDDLSIADTARLLDLSESAVRTRAHRTLQRLRPLVDPSYERATP
ncbi:SigE family RNA polymerase sigma factor [Nocardioides acrostichi]|uniref:SigE family RNA polymerase sigma factor n=1 Tax=Nocardioides acrostichi TaxID=2784339 RepID=UPI002E2B7147|nr:SigE family RNA polymerase sigma factor [Nocardioides acrostichi]